MICITPSSPLKGSPPGRLGAILAAQRTGERRLAVYCWRLVVSQLQSPLTDKTLIAQLKVVAVLKPMQRQLAMVHVMRWCHGLSLGCLVPCPLTLPCPLSCSLSCPASSAFCHCIRSLPVQSARLPCLHTSATSARRYAGYPLPISPAWVMRAWVHQHGLTLMPPENSLGRRLC